MFGGASMTEGRKLIPFALPVVVSCVWYRQHSDCKLQPCLHRCLDFDNALHLPILSSFQKHIAPVYHVTAFRLA